MMLDFCFGTPPFGPRGAASRQALKGALLKRMIKVGATAGSGFGVGAGDRRLGFFVVWTF